MEESSGIPATKIIEPTETMSNATKSNDASPFIKRDQMRREFLRARQRSNNPKPIVKKEDPEQAAEEARKLLQPEALSRRVKREPGKSGYSEFPLRAIDMRDKENVKTNLVKFQSKKPIDPEDFHLPIRLHRKDTRNLQFQLTRAEIVQRQKEIAEFKQRQLEEAGGAGPGTGGSNSTPTASKGNSTGGSFSQSNGKPYNSKQGTPVPGTLNGPKVGVTNYNNTDGPNVNNNGSSSSELKTGTDSGSPPNGKEGTPSNTVTILEEAGVAEDPTKVGMVKYDGKAEPEIHEEGTIDPMADVAPHGGGRFRRGNSKRKTRQLKRLDEEAKRLRFEEFYPWVMEDFDGFNTWVGSYEAGNSDSYVLLSVEDDGSFTMIPADKVYRFTARNKYNTLTIEEAEKRMEKNKEGAPRWFMKHLDESSKTTTRYDRTLRRLRAVDGNTRQAEDDEDRGDNSEVELDYDEEFADDEEAPIIDGNEEENKESEQRIKKEMLQANALGLRDDDGEESDDELFGEKKIDEEGEKVKKALLKTDLGALYESDAEENPYLSHSEEDEEQADSDKKDSEKDNEKQSRRSSPRKKASDTPSGPPKLVVKSINQNIVVLTGEKSVLSNFPAGAWNPNLKKRPAESQPQESMDNKRAKSDHSADDLLTEDDIINAIEGKQLTLKQLIRQLKEKVGRHPDNKERMKVFVKKLVKLNGKFLELSK